MPQSSGTNWTQKVQEQLDLSKGKKQLSLAARRVSYNKEIYHLIIGLGGTGCDAVLESKGYIDLTVRNAGERVAYLGIDTDMDAGKKKSSPETGEATFDNQEFCLLDSAGCKDIFAQRNIEKVRKHSPNYFTWVDTAIEPTGNNDGAQGTRQIGRLILHNNYRNIADRIEKAILKLITDHQANVNNCSLKIYVISGISGGTGSGTFFDMPYLLRAALEHASVGFAKSSISMFGYFFLPDVNERNGGDKSMLYSNGYAALQELDYAMRMSHYKDAFDIAFSTTDYVHVEDVMPFDRVHLLAATTASGTPVPNPYRHAMRAIAQNILSFVANENKQGSDFAVSSFYSNIDRMTTQVVTDLKVPHRYHEYLAIGSAQYELPIDDIMMYVASLLFDDMRTMYSNEPTGEEIDAAMEGLGWTLDGLLTAIRNGVQGAQMLPPASADDLLKGRFDWVNRGQNAYNSIVAQRNGNGLAGVVKNVYNSGVRQFRELTQLYFTDPDKGPVYVNHLIVHEGGILNRLAAFHEALQGYVSSTPQASQRLGELGSRYAAAKSRLAGLHTRKGLENIAAEVNQIGRQYYEECIRYGLAGLMADLIFQLRDHAQTRNERLFDVVVTVLSQLDSIFRNNANILTQGSLTQEGSTRRFSWDTLDVSSVSDVVRDKFSRISSGNVKNLISGFTNALWTEAEVWISDPKSYDPKAFVSDFIDRQFSQIASLSIEDIVTELLNNDPSHATTLQESINNSLMPRLIAESKPLFFEHPGLVFKVPAKELLLISVPNKCQNIYAAIQQYCADNNLVINGANTNCILQLSDINNRIYVQTVRVALPLSSYDIIWQAENEYAKRRAEHGIHLVHAVSDYAPEKKTWRDLCSLIPISVRPDGHTPPNVQVLVNEEKARQELVARLVREKSPAVKLDAGTDEWRLTFRLTPYALSVEDSALTVRKGGDVVKTYDFKTLGGPELDAVQAELEALLGQGLYAVDRNGRAWLTGGAPELSERAISVATIMDAASPANGVDVARTREMLLEDYLCAYELNRAVAAEAEKYTLLAGYLDAFKAHAASGSQERSLMFTFSKLLLLDKIYVDINPKNGHTDLYFSTEPNESLASFGNDKALTDYRLAPAMYMFYKAVVNSDDMSKDYLRKRLNRLIDEAQAELDSAQTDEFTRQHILDAMDQKNLSGIRDRLLRTPGVNPKHLEFYDMLIKQTENLRRTLTRRSASPTAVKVDPNADAKSAEKGPMMIDLDEFSF